MIKSHDFEVIGLAGSTLVECGTALPIVRRLSDGKICRFVVSAAPLQWLPGTEFDQLIAEGRVSPLESPVSLPSSAVAEYPTQPLLLYLNQVILAATATTPPAEWEGTQCVWALLPGESVMTWAACLPGEHAKAILNETAERILDLLDAGIPVTRNSDDDASLLRLADFGLCAATDKELRWRLYLRYGAALPPDRVLRTFESFIQREFPACEWKSYLAEMQSFHAVLFSRHPTHVISAASADSLEDSAIRQRESRDKQAGGGTRFKPVTPRQVRRKRTGISEESKATITAPVSTQFGDFWALEFQIAMLTADIQAITGHLQTHPKDYAGRRGLLSKVRRRRQLLDYLKRQSLEKYVSVITRLNIRK